MALRYVTEAKQFGAALCGCHALCRGLFGSHLAAHAVPQFLGFAVLAACGLRAWFVDGGYLELASTPGVTHASAFGELASTLQIPFQLYDTRPGQLTLADRRAKVSPRGKSSALASRSRA